MKARASKPQTQRFDAAGSDVSACQQAVFDVLLLVGNRQCQAIYEGHILSLCAAKLAIMVCNKEDLTVGSVFGKKRLT